MKKYFDSQTNIYFFFFLCVLSIISMMIGALNIFENVEIVFITRIPRTLSLILSGGGLAVSGLLMQKICRNKFVSQSTGTTISGITLGITISLIFVPKSTIFLRLSFSFFFSVITTTIFVLVLSKIKIKHIIFVPLIGIMLSQIIDSITMYLGLKFGITQSISSIMTGHFSLIARSRYELILLTVPLVILIYLLSNYFNIISLGQNMAKNFGVNYNFYLFLGLILSTLITSCIIVTVGRISYVGLIVPNIISIYLGDNLKKIILPTFLLGSNFLLISDILSRLINRPYEMPIQYILNIFGSLLFIYLLFLKRQSYE